MKLSSIQFTEKKATRDGFGVGILALADQNEKVIVLTADLTSSLKLNELAQKYPKRFVQCGIAEANMMGVAAGLAVGGFIPYATTFANFGTGRVYDQIRQSIAYSHKNVKICLSHAGLTLGEDGATHQILEDIGLMRMLPGMSVVVPCDYAQTVAAVKAIAEVDSPVYLRFGRPSWPIFTKENDFKLGKVQTLSHGTDIAIIATGHLVWNAIEAGKQLEAEGYGVELLNVHTIKPLDVEAVVQAAKKTKKVLVAEEHSMYGGLGELVASTLAKHYPTPIIQVAVNDTFGESGTPDELLKKYGLDAASIYQKAITLLQA